MNLPIRFSGFPNFNDIKEYLPFLTPLLLPGLRSIYDLWQKWGTWKFIIAVSYVGAIVTSSALAYVCFEGNASIYQYTGFIWPFVTPTLISPSHLTSVEASIFGGFTSFFALALIGAGIGFTTGILGLKKLLKKKLNGYSCYQ